LRDLIRWVLTGLAPPPDDSDSDDADADDDSSDDGGSGEVGPPATSSTSSASRPLRRWRSAAAVADDVADLEAHLASLEALKRGTARQELLAVAAAERAWDGVVRRVLSPSLAWRGRRTIPAPLGNSVAGLTPPSRQAGWCSGLEGPVETSPGLSGEPHSSLSSPSSPSSSVAAAALEASEAASAVAMRLDPYAVLGVTKEASAREIKTAYFQVRVPPCAHIGFQLCSSPSFCDGPLPPVL
jgi:hypothetical protein